MNQHINHDKKTIALFGYYGKEFSNMQANGEVGNVTSQEHRFSTNYKCRDQHKRR